MHKIQFEVLTKVKTGKTVSGFFGDRDLTEERWVKREGEVVTGGCGEGGYLLIRFNDIEFGFLDIYTNTAIEGVIEDALMMPEDGSWLDIKNLKIFNG